MKETKKKKRKKRRRRRQEEEEGEEAWKRRIFGDLSIDSWNMTNQNWITIQDEYHINIFDVMSKQIELEFFSLLHDTQKINLSNLPKRLPKCWSMQNMSFYDKVNNIHARIFLKFHYKKIMSYLPWLANSIGIFSAL